MAIFSIFMYNIRMTHTLIDANAAPDNDEILRVAKEMQRTNANINLPYGVSQTREYCGRVRQRFASLMEKVPAPDVDARLDALKQAIELRRTVATPKRRKERKSLPR